MFSGSRIPLSNRGQFVEIQIPDDTFNFNDIGDEVYLDPLKSEFTSERPMNRHRHRYRPNLEVRQGSAEQIY